jgi:hypothetical protein
MASTTPDQVRTVDPFASYNSNVVNKLTRMVTRITDGEGILNSPNDLQVVSDSTSTTELVVKPGIIFKDDMLIFITTEHTVDFDDITHYLGAPGIFSSIGAGYYHVVAVYTFVKSRPAPELTIKILTPAQRDPLDPPNNVYLTSTNITFLKCVEVTFDGANYVISNLYDYDPDDPLERKREFSKWYLSTEVFVPTFDQYRDQGRLIYVTTTGQVWLGTDTQWVAFGVGKITATLNSWTLSSGHYYADIDISGINSSFANVTLQDDATGEIILPEDIIFSSGNVRVWMPVNTLTLLATIIG